MPNFSKQDQSILLREGLKKKYKKVDRRSTLGGGVSQNREVVHFFVLLFLVANLFLLLTVILLFVRAKTLYLMVIPDFSDYLGLSQPLKK